MDSGHRMLVGTHPSSTALSVRRVAGGLELISAALSQKSDLDRFTARGRANIRPLLLTFRVTTLPNPQCMSEVWRKLEHLEGTHKDMEKTYKPHTQQQNLYIYFKK